MAESKEESREPQEPTLLEDTLFEVLVTKAWRGQTVTVELGSEEGRKDAARLVKEHQKAAVRKLKEELERWALELGISDEISEEDWQAILDERARKGKR